MNFIQLNLNHCAAAQNLLSQIIFELKLDVAILSEQYKNLEKNIWEKDLSGRSAIWACGDKAIEEGMKHPTEGFAKIKIGGIYVYSCYISPNINIREFERIVENIALDASQHNPIIIAGDFNASAVEWGCQKTNNRGKIILEAFSSLDIVLLNTGNAFTFRRNGYGSIVDITFASSTLANSIHWKLSEQYTHSDHQAILFSIRKVKDKNIRKGRVVSRGWAADKLDEPAFKESFCNQHIEEGTANNMAENLVRALKSACDVSMPKRRYSNKRKENYWWNQDIAALRRICLRARRCYQRGRSRIDFQTKREAYQTARKNFQNAINVSKINCFKQLCDEADANPWGNAYRIVMTRLKGKKSPQVSCPLLIKDIITTLFPPGELPINETHSRNESDVQPVNSDEILKMCQKIGDKKAPGPDCIPNRALKIAMKKAPYVFAD